MINKLKSYPKQIDNITSDPPPQNEYRDPNILNRKDTDNTNHRERMAPESTILRFRHKPT
jgi:hypothetical protein